MSSLLALLLSALVPRIRCARIPSRRTGSMSNVKLAPLREPVMSGHKCTGDEFQVVSENKTSKHFKYKGRQNSLKDYVFKEQDEGYSSHFYRLVRFGGEDLSNFTDPSVAMINVQSEFGYIELVDLYTKQVRDFVKAQYPNRDHPLKNIFGSDIIRMLLCAVEREGLNLTLTDASHVKLSFMLRKGQTWYETLGLYCELHACDVFRTLKDKHLDPVAFHNWLRNENSIKELPVDFLEALGANRFVSATASPLKVSDFVEAIEQEMGRLVKGAEFTAIVQFEHSTGQWPYVPHVSPRAIEKLQSLADFFEPGEKEALVKDLQDNAPTLDQLIKEFTDIYVRHSSSPLLAGTM